jgi:hypothetical protein
MRIKGEITVKKILGVSLAFLMMLGIVLIGDAISSNGNLSVSARQVTVKHRKRGVGHRIGYHSKRAAHHTANGGRYVYHKSKHGAKWTSRKTVKGSRWTTHKTKRGFKKIIQ